MMFGFIFELFFGFFLFIFFLVAIVLIIVVLVMPARTCPNCGMVQPKFRKPQNAHQAMWGGWTCQNCNCQMDRNGRPIR